MTNRKFYKTIYQIEILSEDPYPIDHGMDDLRTIREDIVAGDCSGSVTCVSHTIHDGEEMAQMLIDQGSEPEFFGIDEDGNEVGRF